MTNVEIGYFDQQMAQYVSDRTVIDDFWDQYPSLTQTEVRNALGALLFTGDEVFKDVRMLSGGEKVRLALAKIFKSRPNMLILSYLAGKEQSRQERRLKKLEEEKERLEREIEDKKTELNDPANASDYVKLQEIQDTIDALEEKLFDTMTEWSE